MLIELLTISTDRRGMRMRFIRANDPEVHDEAKGTKYTPNTSIIS